EGNSVTLPPDWWEGAVRRELKQTVRPTIHHIARVHGKGPREIGHIQPVSRRQAYLQTRRIGLRQERQKIGIRVRGNAELIRLRLDWWIVRHAERKLAFGKRRVEKIRRHLERYRAHWHQATPKGINRRGVRQDGVTKAGEQVWPEIRPNK